MIGNNKLGATTLGGGQVLSLAATGTDAPLFTPIPGPSLSFSERLVRPSRQFRSIKGYEQVFPTGARMRRVAALDFRGIPERTVDYIVTFFEQFDGGVGPFYLDHPKLLHSPLGNMPTLGYTSGGALAEDALFVRYSWHKTSDGTETEPSATASLVRPANNLLTIRAPVRPRGAEDVRFYVGTVEGSEQLVATQAEVTYTEPVGGFPTGGASVKSSNTLRPRLKFILIGEIQPTMVAHDRFDVSLQVHEQTI